MAQAFDLAGRTNPSGCPPSFAQFAEGGNHDRLRNAVGAEGTKSCVGSIATRPCKKRKDGAPPAQMAHTSIVESRATRRPSGFILCSAHPAARFRSNVRGMFRHSREGMRRNLPSSDALPSGLSLLTVTPLPECF